VSLECPTGIQRASEGCTAPRIVLPAFGKSIHERIDVSVQSAREQIELRHEIERMLTLVHEVTIRCQFDVRMHESDNDVRLVHALHEHESCFVTERQPSQVVHTHVVIDHWRAMGKALTMLCSKCRDMRWDSHDNTFTL
jgi:hypothetical protein